MDTPTDVPSGAQRSLHFEVPQPSPGHGLPTLSEVHRIHDRYLREIIEALNLCPFARQSREQGRVHRLVFGATEQGPSPAEAAAGLVHVLDKAPDAEIVLLTFVHDASHPWSRAEAFEPFVRQVREAWDALHHAKRFYLVGFHPNPNVEPNRPTTADSLIPLIRRTPDPVVQCVRAEALDDVRAQAQAQAKARLERKIDALGRQTRALLVGSVHTDPDLSADVARQNLSTVGAGEARASFESLLADIQADRARAYRVVE